MARGLMRVAADRRGSALIEFSILLPFLLTMTVGMVDFGRLYYVRQGLEYATEEAARYYMLNPNTAESNVTTQLRTKMPSGLGPSVNVAYSDTTSCNGTATVTCTTITATYSFSFAAGFLNIGTTTLRAASRAVRLVS